MKIMKNLLVLTFMLSLSFIPFEGFAFVFVRDICPARVDTIEAKKITDEPVMNIDSVLMLNDSYGFDQSDSLFSIKLEYLINTRVGYCEVKNKKTNQMIRYQLHFNQQKKLTERVFIYSFRGKTYVHKTQYSDNGVNAVVNYHHRNRILNAIYHW